MICSPSTAVVTDCDNKTNELPQLYFYTSVQRTRKGHFNIRQFSTKMNLKAHTSTCFSSSTDTPTTYDNSWQGILKEKLIQGQLMKESFYRMKTLLNLLWLPLL